MKPYVVTMLVLGGLLGLSVVRSDEKKAKPALRISTEHKVLKDASDFADILRKDLKAPMRGSFLLELFDKEGAKEKVGSLLPFEVIDLGKLSITTGRVAGFDGVSFSGCAFAKDVPKGKHPVLIAVAQFPPGEGQKVGDQRVAFARLVLSSKKVARWEPALFEDTDVKKLKPGEIVGYGVDVAVGGFADNAARKTLMEAYEKDHRWMFDEVLPVMDKVYKHTRIYGRVSLGESEAILFSSGWGDGNYPSYWGFDADGKLAALMTDFKVVDWRGNPNPPKPKKESKDK